MPLMYGSRKSNPERSYYNPYTFDFITRRVACGAFFLDAADLQVLLNKKITHIINCAQGDAESALLPANFPYLHIPERDDLKAKPTTWFEAGINFALKALIDPKSRVYVHCHAGFNRSPSMTYAILRAQGLTKGHADTLICTARPMAKGFPYRKDADRAILELGYDSTNSR